LEAIFCEDRKRGSGLGHRLPVAHDCEVTQSLRQLGGGKRRHERFDCRM
jgi:hypothetical protein